MRTTKEKNSSASKREEAAEQEESAQPQQRNEQSAAVSEDAAVVLDDIECCLAELDEALDSDKQLKEEAKAGWEELEKNNNIYRRVTYEDYTAIDGYTQDAQMWMARYGHLFRVCCGGPVFDE